jgi:hypothetical protein
MSSTPPPNPSDCLTAQTTPDILDNGPLNPDIGGFAVGVASAFDTFKFEQ